MKFSRKRSGTSSLDVDTIIQRGEAGAPPDLALTGHHPEETSYVLTLGEQQFFLHDGENVIGRDPAADVVLDSPAVSRRHARIVLAGGQAHLEDLGSKNGTYLGDVRVDHAVVVAHSAAIRFGPVWLLYRSSLGGA